MVSPSGSRSQGLAGLGFMLVSVATAFPEAERTDPVPMLVVTIVGFGCRLEPDTALLGVLAAAGATVAAALLTDPDPDVPASDFFGKSTTRREFFLPFSSFFPAPLPLLPSLLTKVKVRKPDYNFKSMTNLPSVLTLHVSVIGVSCDPPCAG